MNPETATTLIVTGITVIAVVSVVISVVIVFIFGRKAFKVFKASSGPEITGPALRGTAHVLSMQTTGSTISFSGQDYYVCNIALRVEIPGCEPYDVTIQQRVHLLSIAPLQSGAAIPVLVDSTNPQNVRIDFSQPMIPSGGATGSFGPAGEVASLATQFRQNPGAAGGFVSATDLLTSGQRVPGVLKSFAATGTTPRSLGKTPSRPEYLDEPIYVFELELQFPNRAPVDGKAGLVVPHVHVPTLAVGLQLPCVVDPGNPAQHFVVDWDSIPQQDPAAPASAATAGPVAAAPVIAPPQRSASQRLQELETLRATGAISEAEYGAKRQKIISDL